MTLRRAVHRLLALVRKQRLDDELDSEIQAHIELAERDAVARGLTSAEARTAALRSFGGIEVMREDHRDRRAYAWLEALLRDARYGCAALLREPGFASVAIGVLALGIGANVAMFSITDAVLLKPLPFPDPDRIVRVWDAPRPGVMNATSTPDFLDWRRLATDFEALSAEQGVAVALAGESEPTRLVGKAVTADYFRVFGVHARLGRTWTRQEDAEGVAPVIVLSHAAWQTWFGGATDILQRRPILDGEPHQVIGVLAPGAFDRDRTAFWKPLSLNPDPSLRGMHWLTVYGRVRSAVTLERARQQMLAIHAGLESERTINDRGGSVVVEPLSRLTVGPGLQRSIYVAFGAVGLVLLIACANVANLLLARGAAREREMAARAALGAGRSRLIAQLLTESLVLSVFGAAAGIVLAIFLIHAAEPALADMLPFTAGLTLDLRVLAFAAGLAIAVCLIAGSAPALQAGRGDLVAALNRGSRGSSRAHARARRIIVVGEVALSLVLVCGALLLFRSLSNLQSLDTGIRTEHILTMSVDLPARAYPTPERAAQFYESVTARLRNTPGVTSAAMATHLPLRWIGNGEAMQVPGFDRLVRVRFKRVDAGYFHTLGIPVLAGRGVVDRDRPGAPLVAVINEALLRRFKEIPGMGDPVGKVVRLSRPSYAEPKPFMPQVEIVGVIRSERVNSPGLPDPPVVYVPLAQAPDKHVSILVRSTLDAAAVMPAIREAIGSIDRTLPIEDIATMEQVRDATLSRSSRPAWVIGTFACVAVLLTAIGLCGVLSQAVTQRRRELGIRIALGATTGNLLGHVLKNAAALVTIGLAIGLVGASAVTRVLKNLLYEVSPLDPAAFAFGVLAMLFIGLAAALIPAARAVRLDPVATLREEG